MPGELVKCGQCGKDKPAEELVNRRGNPRKHCCACSAEMADWYKRNQETVKAKTSAYRQANYAKVTERDRRYRETHREQFAEVLRAFNDANPGANAQRHREWREQNPLKVQEYAEQYREQNREVLKQRCKSWREQDIERANGLARRWYWENREQALRAHKEWRERNPGVAEECSRKWAEEHPDKTRAYGRARRARLSGAEGKHTAADILWLYEQQGGRCEACRKKLVVRGQKIYHVDHMEPLSRGGRNDISNLQLLCQPCNSRKQAIPYEEWCAKVGRLHLVVEKVS